MNVPETDTILVRAADGRVIDFTGPDAPTGYASGSVRLSPGDDPIRVPNTVGNRRRVRGADLIVVEEKTVLVDHALADRVDALLADADTGPTKAK